ncbi:DUF1003 domain-containing protein [Myceligenerans cantabricum]
MADRLDRPKASGFRRPRFDPDLVGKGAETFARFMGTGQFLMWMTLFVVVWVTLNAVALWGLRWDPFPFILLNLFFSVQASYAAPLILLAQNRQDDRDRVLAEQDRQRGERNLADTEYLAREMASLRMLLSEVATRDYVRSELRALLEELDERREREDTTGRDQPQERTIADPQR